MASGVKHAKLSPSSAKRWYACPGSVYLTAGLPSSPTSIHAAEGTLAHKLCEWLVNGDEDELSIMGKIGQTMEQDGFTIEITDEMVNAALVYLDTITKDKKEMESSDKPAPVELKTEMRVKAFPGVWGTCDCILYRRGDRLIVYDFKYGKGVAVSPEDNPQLSIYALGAMNDDSVGFAFNSVEVVIVQPRAGGVKRAVLDVKAAKKSFADALTRVEDPLAPTVAGEWCRWCPAASVCGSLKGKAQEAAKADFALAPAPVSAVGMTNEQMGKALAWEGVVTTYFSSLREAVRAKLEAGEEVPGWKLVAGRSIRKWVDEAKVVKEYEDLLGDRLWEKKLVSPARLEKIVGKGVLEEKGLTMKPEAARTVAPEGDPRPRMIANEGAKKDFAPVWPQDEDKTKKEG